MSPFIERRYLSQDGLSLYYRDYGDPLSPATPILCLAGLTRNSKDFHQLAVHLSDKRRVICPDYRGRGRSDYSTDPGDYHPQTIVNDIRHLMAVEGLHRVIAIGTSFGGLLSMGLGIVSPSALKAVILNDVGPKISDRGMTRILEYIGQDRPQPSWDSAIAEMKRLFPTMSCETEEEWLEAARATWREALDGTLHFDWDTKLARVMRKSSRSVDRWVLFKALYPVPVLVLRGGLSDVLSARTVSRMEELHPDLTAVTVTGSGHPPSLSEPEAREALDEFIARI